MRPQLDSKAAAVMLAFMAGVCVGLVDQQPLLIGVGLVLCFAAIWQYRLEPHP